MVKIYSVKTKDRSCAEALEFHQFVMSKLDRKYSNFFRVIYVTSDH